MSYRSRRLHEAGLMSKSTRSDGARNSASSVQKSQDVFDAKTDGLADFVIRDKPALHPIVDSADAHLAVLGTLDFR